MGEAVLGGSTASRGTPKLNKAWAEVMQEIENPSFDSKNPHFGNEFASLKSVIKATVPVAAKHGIAVFTELVTTDHGIGAYVHLCHESGEEKRFGPYSNRPTKNDPQGEASASTYARRYALQSLFNVVGEKDDDGNAASVKQKKMPEKQAKEIAALIDAANLETGEGVDAFGEAWIELGQDEQLTFGPWITNFWPGGVSAAKQRMRDIMTVYRQRNNTEEAA